MGVAFKLFLLALPFAAFGALVDEQFELNRQVILRDEKSAAHVMVSASPEAPMQRLVVALPPMNSAVAVQFIRGESVESEEPFTATMEGDPETYDEDGFHGVKVDIAFSGAVLLNNTVVGSARTVRDFVEGGILHWTEDEETRANYFSYVFTPSDCVGGTSCQINAGAQFRQLDIKRKFFTTDDEVHLRVEAPANVVMEVTTDGLPNGTYNVTASRTEGSGPFTLTFRADTNIPALVGIEADQIFTEEYSYLLESERERAQQLSFLSWTTGWVAGSWRFNTYFGRDTLLTLAMMQDKVQWSIQASVLGAALARIQNAGTEDEPTGAVCHEANLGDFAQWNGGDVPHERIWVCDYKMVDSDYLLLPVLARAARQFPSEIQQFLTTVSSFSGLAYRTLIARNVALVIESAKAFAADPVYSNLVKIRHETVGNWRDSNEGLGWGIYPFDVNAVFVPAALRGVIDLAETGVIDLIGSGTNLVELASLAEVWEDKALALFRVGYGSAFVANRPALDAVVRNYAAEGPGMLNLDISSTLGESTEADLPEEYFFAVSLRADGRPVPVLNTDVGFLLFFRDDLSAKDVKECARAASVPFPRGLWTDVGVVVGNPAYAFGGHYSDEGLVPDYGRTVTEALGRNGYHGTVVWSWQQALLLQGLTKYSKQQNPETQQVLGTALGRVWGAVENAKSHQNAEMWGFDYADGTYSVVDFGALTGGTTEGNIIQLWSYAFMGMAPDDGDTTSSTTTTTTTTTTTQRTDSAAAFSITGVLLSFIVALF